MLCALSEKVKRMTTAKALLLLALFFVIMFLLINGQPFGIAEFNERFCNLTPLDSRGSYTTEEVCVFMEKIGAPGRMFYARMLLMLDFAFPLSYTLFWAAAISFLFGKFIPGSSKLRYISLLPFIAGLADYLENILILSMLGSFPKILSLTVTLSSAMTYVKDLFMWICLILLLLGLLLYLIRLIGRTLTR